MYKSPGKTIIESMSIDEFDEHRLIAELERRNIWRKEGRCDYCGRPCGSIPDCLMPRRHRGIIE